MESHHKFDHLAGDPERQRLAAERAEAIRKGTLKEFEARQDPANDDAKLPETAEEIVERNRKIREGAPEAAFLAQAAQYKMRVGGKDPRSVKEIAKAMMEGEELAA